MPLEEAISPHARCVIIGAVARQGEWEGMRGGYRIRLVRYRAQGKTRVEYAVRIRLATWVSDHATTTGAALDDINALIQQERAQRIAILPAPEEKSMYA